MNSTDKTILTVAPAAKRFGVAVFNGAELIYFAVKILKPPRTDESIKEEISGNIKRLIKDFSPNVIVIKSPGKQQQASNRFKLITDQTESEANFNQTPFIKINFEAVKKSLCPDGKRSKVSVFKALAQIYPELTQFLNRPNKWQTDYWDAVLTAAAVGYCYQLNKKKLESLFKNHSTIN